MKRIAWSVDLGWMEYKECFDLQRRLLDQVAAGAMPDLLLSVEHPSVYTLGANFHEENLPLPRDHYRQLGVDIQPTDRGGDITFHGPKQLVMYPIFNLKHYGQDLHAWLRNLEEGVIQTLRTWGLEGRRFPPNTGVWVGDEKVCAIGIKVRKWTSMHGIALNCNNDLGPFDWIVPCGIKGFGVSSISKLSGQEVSIESARPVLEASYAELFDLEVKPATLSQLLAELNRLESHAEAAAHRSD